MLHHTLITALCLLTLAAAPDPGTGNGPGQTQGPGDGDGHGGMYDLPSSTSSCYADTKCKSRIGEGITTMQCKIAGGKGYTLAGKKVCIPLLEREEFLDFAVKTIKLREGKLVVHGEFVLDSAKASIPAATQIRWILPPVKSAHYKEIKRLAESMGYTTVDHNPR